MEQEMMAAGARFIASEWIAKHRKPTGHKYTCECDQCQLNMAAAFMDYLLTEAQKDKAKIHAITSATAESVRAYRAAMRR